MVNPQPGISAISVSKVVPESVDNVARVQLPQRIRPALREQHSIGLAHFRSEQRIVYPAFGFVDVEIGGDDVIVSGQHRGAATANQFGRVDGQTLEPAKFVIEFGTGGRVAVRKIEAADDETLDRSFDVAAMSVVRITREHPADFDRVCAASKDGDTIPALLPVPDDPVACIADRSFGKFLMGSLQFLKAYDVGRIFPEPAQYGRQPRADAIDVECCDLHRPATRARVSASE